MIDFCFIFRIKRKVLYCLQKGMDAAQVSTKERSLDGFGFVLEEKGLNAKSNIQVR